MREQIDKQRNDDGKSSAQCKSIFRAAPDPFVISGPVILCGESGVGISEILHRQIGKGINFTAAANAAMTAGPKLLTSPCTIRMPKFMTDC